jgi:hypothetical protein
MCEAEKVFHSARLDASPLTLEVRLDTARSDRLGEDDDAALEEPREEDGRAVDLVLLGNGDDDLVLAQVGALGTAQGGVRLGDDAVVLEPLDELELRDLDGELDLVLEVSAAGRGSVVEGILVEGTSNVVAGMECLGCRISHSLATGLILASLSSFWCG